MPLYEYECLGCREKHEIMQKISDAPLSSCPRCGGRLKKLISNTSFILKGTGWYATDYKAGDRKKALESETAEAQPKTESKPAEKTDTQATPK